jgi:hypothetical protein
MSDMFISRVLEIYDFGNVREVCSNSDYPSGLGFAPDGSLLVVSQSERRVKRWTGTEFQDWADLTDIPSVHSVHVQ